MPDNEWGKLPPNTYPIPATVTIDLEDWIRQAYSDDDEPGQTVGEMLVERAAYLFLNKALKGTDHETRTDFRAAVQRQIEQITKEQVTELVKNACRQTLQRTNEWGKPMGEPQSFEDYVRNQVQAVMNKRVNNQGQDANSYDKGTITFVEYVIRREAAARIDGMIKQQTEAFAEAAKAAVAEMVAAKLGPKV